AARTRSTWVAAFSASGSLARGRWPLTLLGRFGSSVVVLPGAPTPRDRLHGWVAVEQLDPGPAGRFLQDPAHVLAPRGEQPRGRGQAPALGVHGDRGDGPLGGDD